MTPLTITPSGPLAKFLLSVPTTLCFSDLEVLVPNCRTIPPGDTSSIPLSWKLYLLPCCFGFLMPLNQQAMKGGAVLDEMTDPDYQGNNELLATVEVRKIMSGIQEIPLVSLTVIMPCD